MNAFDSSIALSLFGGSSGSTGIDTDLLNSYYSARAGVTGQASSATSGAAASGGTSSTKTNSPTGQADAPTAPWIDDSVAPPVSTLVNNVMEGQSFINSGLVTSSVLQESPDYSKLFTLYEGLNALEGIAEAAQAKNVSSYQLQSYQRRFLQGISQVSDYIDTSKFDHVDLTAGTLTSDLKNTDGAARTNTTYVGPDLHQGTTSDAVKAFDGAVKFSMTVQRVGTATPYVINFDLSEMGTQTRSMSNVVSYMNSKLKDAGVSTRFAVHTTAAVPTTETVNGKTVTLSEGRPSFGLQINGVSYETATFSAAASADSVFVAQSTGDPTKTPATSSSSSSSTTSTTSTASSTSTSATTTGDGTDVTSQLMKFQTDADATGTFPDATAKVGSTYSVDGEIAQTKLSSAVADVTKGTTQSTNTVNDALATAAGPDGSVYVLANVNAQVNGQDIQGNQDVALMKYDSAGHLVYTRTLGASQSASGYALAVSADGKVAVTGSVTGALNIDNASTTLNKYGLPVATGIAASTAPLSGPDATTADTFVTMYDASGVEQWTQRYVASAQDQGTSVTFGANDTVYVGGKTASKIPGADGQASGGTDAYVSGFSAQGKLMFTQQFGTSGTDYTQKMVTDGNTLYVASTQNNDTVLTSYDVSSGKPVEIGSRSLGGLGGGEISGMSVSNGKLYLGGSSGSGTLLGSQATVTRAYSGGFDAFALSVDTDLTKTAGDTVAYYGGTGQEKNAQVSFTGGTAWIAGQTTGDIADTTKIGKQDGYLAQLDVASGQVVSQKRWSGTDGTVNVGGIAVNSGGSSVLDALGLPQGTVVETDSNLITASTSVRAGDYFYMQDPGTGVKTKITIDPTETMATLAKKIERASEYNLTVDTTKVLGKPLDQLEIKPSNPTSEMEFIAGGAGQDALKGLGLSAGLVSNAANNTMDASSNDYLTSKKEMGLSFNGALNLNSPENITAAITALKATMANVQKVYTYLKYGDPQSSSSSTKTGNTSGQVPAYLTSQIANYQAALQRLTGGS
ncbi:transcriptional regulator [Asticcacaulis solisilvae]|uniref:transcriptional regulator n=1 Tax=Asticcacaulis solisilvae TaxID=1217274 RepID=UPI003FD7A6BC